jgi:ABC-type glutathione transport system ATPase component
LDDAHKSRVIEVLRVKLRAEGMSAVVVSHDAADLAALCDRIVSFD